ncbi:MAG: phosphoribosylglycinamide formyltransferase [Candidatus Adiutricales bacterium]
MKKVTLGVLVSGSGSNLQAIIDNIEASRLSAEIKVVISNEPEAYGLVRAENHHIRTMVVNHRDYDSREAFDQGLVTALKENGVELVILAGFMRVITPTFLKAFHNRILNIHPALLPAFPGVHVWQEAIDYGVKFSGCTVHFVDEGTDTGPVIIQSVVPVLDDDDADSLSARILKQEHKIYSRAIQLFAQGRLEIEGRRVKILPLDKTLSSTFLTNPRLEEV